MEDIKNDVFFCFIPLGDGRTSRDNGTIRKLAHAHNTASRPGNVLLLLTHSHHPSSPQSPCFPALTTCTNLSGRVILTTMLKKMTHRFTHFHASQKPRSNQLDQPQLPAALPYFTEHRASISTQRTSLSEWSKREDSMESTRPILQRRPKATYSIQDFVIHRTLGTGSFGRVHLGKTLVSYRVWDSGG